MRGSGPDLGVQGQRRAYATVVGVTLAMLAVGLGVPLAFGRTPGGASQGSQVTLDPGFASAAPTAEPVAPGAAATPGAVPTTGSGPLAPGAPGPGGATGVTPGRSVPGSPTAPSTTRLTATDQGVTATTVKVGVVLLDIRKLEPVGFSQPHFTPAEQQQRFSAFFASLNKKGGLSGRKVVPVFVTWDALDTNGSHSGAAVCIQLAQNEKVFAAVGFLGGNIAECLTSQYGIPAIADTGHLTEAYAKGKHLLVSPFAALERGTANWGYLASRSGLLKGRTLGTVSMDVPEESRPEQSLNNALAAEGNKVSYRAKLASDAATAQSQLPVEISKMHSAGVNTVFLSTNFIMALQFAQTADKQGFRPQYVVSDLGSLQAEGLVRSMPASFNGAFVFTQSLTSTPETAPNTACRKEFNANNGSGQDFADLKDEGGSLTLACWMTRVLRQAADRVGPQLTRKAMGPAFQQLGTPLLPHTQPGSFRLGKTDWVDWMRIGRYATSCRCYQPLAGSQKGKY